MRVGTVAPIGCTSGLEVVVPQNGGGRGWQWDEDSGSKVMPKKWTLLLDWLLQGPDRDPKHQYEWAAEAGIHEDSVRRIKRDVRFAKEWDRREASGLSDDELADELLDQVSHLRVVGE